MVVKIKSGSVSLDANTTDYELFSLTVPEGKKVTILEVAYACPSDGKITAYIGEEKVDEVSGAFSPDENHRVVVNRELPAGETFKIKGTSVTAGDFKYLIIYDEVKT